MADTLWSVRRVRKLWRDSSAPALELAQPRATEQDGLSFAEPDETADESLSSQSPGPRQVYYDKDGIVGAGTPFTLLPLTVPLDKPLNPEQDVDEFAANDLLDYISEHLVSQGPRDGQRHGYAHPPRSADDDQSDRQAAHFTYGLPDLDVREVVAVPVPKSRKILLLPVKSMPLRHPELAPDQDVAQVAGRSPSWHPERHYVQAITASWEGNWWRPCT